VFRFDHDALLQQRRTKLENNLNVYESMPEAIELRHQQNVLTKLYSELQETVAQRDAAQRQLSEKFRKGLHSVFLHLHCLCIGQSFNEDLVISFQRMLVLIRNLHQTSVIFLPRSAQLTLRRCSVIVEIDLTTTSKQVLGS